jgi:hypothetical protein
MGDVGFLIELVQTTRNSTRFELRDLPAYTNQSHQPRLYGWCGTTNDISCHAAGMAKVIRLARNGRALVQQIEGDELAAALDDLGFPELTPENDMSNPILEPAARLAAMTPAERAEFGALTDAELLDLLTGDYYAEIDAEYIAKEENPMILSDPLPGKKPPGFPH